MDEQIRADPETPHQRRDRRREIIREWEERALTNRQKTAFDVIGTCVRERELNRKHHAKLLGQRATFNASRDKVVKESRDAQEHIENSINNFAEHYGIDRQLLNEFEDYMMNLYEEFEDDDFYDDLPEDHHHPVPNERIPIRQPERQNVRNRAQPSNNQPISTAMGIIDSSVGRVVV